MSLYRLSCFFLFCILSLSMHCQSDSALKLNKQEWQEMSEGVDYTEHYKELEPKEQEKPQISGGSSDYRLGNFKYVFYFLVLVIIVFIIYWVFKNLNNKNETLEKKVTIESMKDIEDNIHEVNLEDLLRDALLAKNYKIALRLNFLIVIKLLSQKEKINWAKDKTNWEYYSELKEKLLADQFKEIIKSFEIFWYGEHTLTELQYHATEPAYRALQNQLTKNE